VVNKRDGSFTRRITIMTRQHHNSFAQSVFGSAKRIFRSNKDNSVLAPAHIDAHIARDIGVNMIGLY
jgi:hypothetical protein